MSGGKTRSKLVATASEWNSFLSPPPSTQVYLGSLSTSMRTYSLLSAILTIVALSFVASAEPIPPRNLVASNPRVGQVERDINNNRVGVAFGRPPSGQVYIDQKRREWKEVGGTKRTSNGESAGGGGGGSADGAANYVSFPLSYLLDAYVVSFSSKGR